MSTVETLYEHIVVDAHKEPVIAGTRIKVSQLVLDKIAYGWSAEEMLFQHPQFTLGQVYAALAYYADHQEEMDSLIEKQLDESRQLASRIRQPQNVLERIRRSKDT